MYYGSSLREKPKMALFFLEILGLLVVGCTQSESGEVHTPTMEGQLIPYKTATPNPEPDLSAVTQTSTSIPTEIPLPTPTPFFYKVVENDTLTGIAFQHSIPLEDLIAANPGIDPNFLTIGMTLTIPMEGVISAALPTPTPASIIIRPPVCYSLLDGDFHCMSAVENDQAYAAENVVVMISLQSPSGNNRVSQSAIMPLNIIPAGQKAAVAATFAPPLLIDQVAGDSVAHASLLSAIPVLPEDQRYLQTELDVREIAISHDGQEASITGTVKLLPEQPVANAVWVSAFAYDVQNNIVGIRKWVAKDVLTSGEQITFEFVVYSLGFSIERVDILAEARP
jgi:hypothetical protein